MQNVDDGYGIDPELYEDDDDNTYMTKSGVIHVMPIRALVIFQQVGIFQWWTR